MASIFDINDPAILRAEIARLRLQLAEAKAALQRKQSALASDEEIADRIVWDIELLKRRNRSDLLKTQVVAEVFDIWLEHMSRSPEGAEFAMQFIEKSN